MVSRFRTEPEEAAVKWALEKKLQDALHVCRQNQISPVLMQLLGTRNACEKSVQAMARNVNSANIYKCALINGVCIEARYDMSN
jgi:hypothetical protein